MRLNTIAPAEGAKKIARRVGRGVGSGFGKTAARGHKGQKSRAGGYHKVGFEGGQMPLQRRLPKRGFTSMKRDLRAELSVGKLAGLGLAEIDLLALKQAGAVPRDAEYVKIIAGGAITTAVKLKGIAATASAKSAIEAAGGSVELAEPVKLKRLPKKNP